MIETSKEYVYGTRSELRDLGFNPELDSRNFSDTGSNPELHPKPVRYKRYYGGRSEAEAMVEAAAAFYGAEPQRTRHPGSKAARPIAARRRANKRARRARQAAR